MLEWLESDELASALNGVSKLYLDLGYESK